jgi:hypothetical protein
MATKKNNKAQLTNIMKTLQKLEPKTKRDGETHMATKKKIKYNDSAKRAEEILKLIRTNQEAKNVYELLKKENRLPTVAETLSSAQNKRLRPLAWLINDQKYTVQEILNVALEWSNHENKKETA